MPGEACVEFVDVISWFFAWDMFHEYEDVGVVSTTSHRPDDSSLSVGSLALLSSVAVQVLAQKLRCCRRAPVQSLQTDGIEVHLFGQEPVEAFNEPHGSSFRDVGQYCPRFVGEVPVCQSFQITQVPGIVQLPMLCLWIQSKVLLAQDQLGHVG